MREKKGSYQRSFLTREDGVSAIEFAILTPIFILVLIAIVEFGSAILIRIEINSRISSISNYFTISGQRTYPEDLISELLNAHGGAAIQNISLNINNSIFSELGNGGFQYNSTSTPPSNCYCPSGAQDNITWGSPVSCGNTCPSGSRAGRYVLVSMEGRQPLLFGRFIPENSVARTDAFVKID